MFLAETNLQLFDLNIAIGHATSMRLEADIARLRVGMPPALCSRPLDVGHKLNDRVRCETVVIAKDANLAVIERDQSVGCHAIGGERERSPM